MSLIPLGVWVIRSKNVHTVASKRYCKQNLTILGEGKLGDLDVDGRVQICFAIEEEDVEDEDVVEERVELQVEEADVEKQKKKLQRRKRWPDRHRGHGLLFMCVLKFKPS